MKNPEPGTATRIKEMNSRLQTAEMLDSTKLWRYVERYFQRSGQTEWPTVARAAKGLGWTKERIEEAVEGDPDGRLMFTTFDTDEEAPMGDVFIESVLREDEA